MREAEDACAEGQRKVALEYRGQLPPPEGSGRAGAGPMAVALERNANALCERTDQARRALADLTEATQLRSDEARSLVRKAEADFARAQAKLDALLTAQDVLADAIRRESESPGLLTRLSAWGQITSAHSAARLADAALLVGFGLIQVLPILFVVLMQRRGRAATSQHHQA